jgi:uncharacterized protein involved in exopolysaccharide biosynthesis
MSFLLGLPILVLVLLAIVALFIHFFLGVTVIGWIVALVWALQDRPRYV